MPKTNTKISAEPNTEGKPSVLTNSAFELVNWPALSSVLPSVNEKVFAIQTTRLPFSLVSPLTVNFQKPTTPALKNELRKNESSEDQKSSFNSFNLGLHVDDCVENVILNRNKLNKYISEQLALKDIANSKNLAEPVNIQWLEQVHGNHVADVSTVSSYAITADASITRQKNIALAIMTADCLPILLSHNEGAEIAAIHGGWRPLAANIIEKTIEKMHSNSAELVAWLGPCIGNEAFEVGIEVKEAFTQQDKIFTVAFVKQKNGKYLADLHKIAEIQLQSLGVRFISSLDECTYQRTDKYYSYRKEQVTGRMASIICRR